MKTLLLSILLSSISPHLFANNDFDKVCDAFQSLANELHSHSLTPKEQGDFIHQKIEKLSKDSSAYFAFNALRYFSPAESRYNMFVESAFSAGFKNWQCKPMQDLYSDLVLPEETVKSGEKETNAVLMKDADFTSITKH